jgi:hypothetical protein
LLVLALGSAAQTPSHSEPGDFVGPLAHIQPPPPHHRFPEGQSYVYAADWRIWAAGTTTLRMESSGTLQHVTATADSSGVVAVLFRVHDRFESWFDTHTFCSQRISKQIEEGLRKRDTSITFDYQRRKAVLEETNLRTGEKKRTEEDIPACTTDVLSGIFYVASLPLQLGAVYKFPLNDGGRTVEVSATPEVREQVKTDAGVFSTVRVELDAKSGVLKDRGRIWLWYTDDAQRIPVQMRARLFWGTLTMKLQRVQK